MLRSLFVALSVAFLLAPPVAALGFSNLYVFGDSIVDTGNTQQLVVSLGAPDPAPAAAGYFDGRFTNGVNPADVVNAAIEGTNIGHSLGGGDNFSFGGARARDNSPADFIPDLATQVLAFNGAVGGVADPNALYLINVGGNDVFDMLNGADVVSTISAAVSAITNSVLTLYGLGAQHVLFVGVGDVGSTPAAVAAGPAAVAGGRALSLQLNGAIQAALPASVSYFDTIGLTDQVVANPAAFGLPAGLIFGSACLGSGAPDPGGPPSCDDYAFFDTIHPTSQVLQVLGDELVAAVPEPGTALLLAIGLTGLAARRRAA